MVFSPSSNVFRALPALKITAVTAWVVTCQLLSSFIGRMIKQTAIVHDRMSKHAEITEVHYIKAQMILVIPLTGDTYIVRIYPGTRRVLRFSLVQIRCWFVAIMPMLADLVAPPPYRPRVIPDFRASASLE